MTWFMKEYFSKNKKYPESKAQEYSLNDFDKTFAIPMGILKLVGLRLTRIDSTFIRLCWNAFYWFEFTNIFVATWLELIKMVQTSRGGSFQDAIDIFRMMPCVGYLLLAMAKSYKIVCYRPVYENLVSELRSMWPRGPVSAEEHRIIATALRHLNYIVKGYYWCNTALPIFFLIPPYVDVLRRAFGQTIPYVLPFFFWFPFDPLQRVYYEIVLGFQTWQALLTIWFMLCGDLFFCIFLSHITIQFDLLSIRIERLMYVPTDRHYVESNQLGKYTGEYKRENEEELENVYQRELADIIMRHHALIRLSGDVEDMFSFALLVNAFNSSIILCFCGFCCVIVEKWNEIVYKSFMTTALSQTWLLCWYGQRLLDSSKGVSEALYRSGWYKAPKKIRNSILIMLHRSQKEVRVTTYGFSVMSLSSYTTIIKTSWSYFTLLLHIYKQ